MWACPARGERAIYRSNDKQVLKDLDKMTRGTPHGFAANAPEQGPLVHPVPDLFDVPHHLSRPREHFDRGARHQQGIRLRQSHDGLHLQRLRLGLCRLSGSRRLARRPLRRAQRIDAHRHLLVDHDGGDGGGLQRDLVHRRSFPVRHRRSRRLSGGDAGDAELVSEARTRFRAGASPTAPAGSGPPSRRRLSCSS